MPEVIEVGAAQRGVHLTLPLACGAGRSEVVLEAAHGEWLFHCAAHRAVRDGLLGFGEPVFARFVPGQLRDTHEHALCLGTVVVELTDAGGRAVGHQEFGSDAFATSVTSLPVGVQVVDEVGGGHGRRIEAIDGDTELTTGA